MLYILVGVVACVFAGFLHDRFRNPFQTPMVEFTVSDYRVFIVVLFPVLLLMIVGSRFSNWLSGR